MKKVAFYTLGCKLNFAETSSISRYLKNDGFTPVNFSDPADLYVINTCSVTKNADKKCRYIIKKAIKSNPNGLIAITGCYAQLQPKEIAKIDGVDIILGATEKFNIGKYVHELTKKKHTEVHSCEINEANFFVESFSIPERTRSFLKIQDGCDYKCSYCTIPKARGISRSDTLKNIVSNAKKIAEKGVKEIVLTGVNIGDYGKGEFGNKKHNNTLLELIQALDNVKGIKRFRISSIEPNLLKDEIIEFVAQSRKFVPHFHIPLQSGSNKVLKKMKRRYLKELYTSRINKIKSLMPNCCIGADVIVGFPGETHIEFLNTYNYLQTLDISYLHVFPYSERKNTSANKIQNNIVSKSTRSRRSKMLRILSVKKKISFYKSQLKQEKLVLFEQKNKNGWIHGFTDNYIKVKIPYNTRMKNKLIPVFLEEINTEGSVNATICLKKSI